MQCSVDVERSVAIQFAPIKSDRTESVMACGGTSRLASENENLLPDEKNLIEYVVASDNMRLAYKRVERNRGSSGIDKMNVEALKPYLNRHWSDIKENLLKGSYEPKAVREVEIPKDSGGVRKLGIPTVLDRLIQQALHQVLSPLFEPGFSDYSYGFRPGRSAHQAIHQAKTYQYSGKRWVVDMDLKQFFDEVNHDILISLISRKVKDRRILQVIRKYLNAGIMKGGVVTQRTKGTPQGGPLSPLLSNILLNELDKELERRGHSFCRYADNCNIYVGSRKAGERVLASITRFVEKKLRLKVNHEKSAVDRPWNRTFLGFTFSRERKCNVRIAPKSIMKLRKNLKVLFRKGKGRNLKRFIKDDLNPAIRGWINYFRITDTKVFAEKLDEWIRRRLRLILWKQWKRPWTRYQKLLKCGINEERARQSAFNKRGPWFNSGASHMNQAFRKRFFECTGLESILVRLLQFRTTST